MKKYFLSKYTIGAFLLMGLAPGFTSCEDVNDWDTDSSKSQMFTPVTFETSRVSATAVDLSFSSVPNAKSYIVEYSKDSLEFSTIVGSIEMLTEELIPDSASTGKRYLASLKNMDASTRYSARIKAVSNNGLPDSNWGSITFKTPGEQVLNTVSDISENSAAISWESGIAVTHIVLTPEGGTSQKITLTADNIAQGELLLAGLTDNKTYVVQIFNEAKQRGSSTFKTFPKISGEGTKYYLKGSEDIQAYLDGLTDTKVVLVLPAGSEYNVGSTLIIPSHMTSVTLWGLPGEGQSKMIFKEIKLDNSVANFNIWMHNMELQGTDATADYVMNDNSSNPRNIGEFKIDNCNVNTFRGVFRMRGALTVGKIEISNSLISNLTDYGIIRIDAATVSVGSVSLTNSTVFNLNNADVIRFRGVASSLIIDHCTFYNAQTKDKYLANFDNKTEFIPATFAISNCLFGGSSADISTKATNPKIESTFVTNSYKANDYTVASNYPLSGISDYTKSSADLFENPASNNFKVIDTTVGGEAQPGDPRWW